MPHQVVRLAQQLFLGIAADLDEGAVAVTMRPLRSVTETNVRPSGKGNSRCVMGWLFLMYFLPLTILPPLLIGLHLRRHFPAWGANWNSCSVASDALRMRRNSY